MNQKLSYSSLWKVIISDLEHYSTVTRHFLDSYFTTQNHPNLFLKESIEYACNLFNLRNNFDAKDEQQYLRNTILLQNASDQKQELDSFQTLALQHNLPVIVQNYRIQILKIIQKSLMKDDEF